MALTQAGCVSRAGVWPTGQASGSIMGCTGLRRQGDYYGLQEPWETGEYYGLPRPGSKWRREGGRGAGREGGWWWKGLLWAGGLLRPEARLLWAARAFGGQRGEQRGMAPAAGLRGGPLGGVGSLLWDGSLYLLRGLLLQHLLWDGASGRGRGAGGLLWDAGAEWGGLSASMLPPSPRCQPSLSDHCPGAPKDQADT